MGYINPCVRDDLRIIGRCDDTVSSIDIIYRDTLLSRNIDCKHM